MDDRYRIVYEYLNLRNVSGEVQKITIAGEGQGLAISVSGSKLILFLELDNSGDLKLHIADDIATENLTSELVLTRNS